MQDDRGSPTLEKSQMLRHLCPVQTFLLACPSRRGRKGTAVPTVQRSRPRSTSLASDMLRNVVSWCSVSCGRGETLQQMLVPTRFLFQTIQLELRRIENYPSCPQPQGQSRTRWKKIPRDPNSTAAAWMTLGWIRRRQRCQTPASVRRQDVRHVITAVF